MTRYMQLSQNERMADGSENEIMEKIDITYQRFPYCIVWTPIPLLTWMVRRIQINVLGIIFPHTLLIVAYVFM